MVNSKNQAALAALGFVPATPESDAGPTPAKPVPSFDGGARQSPALEPEDHGTWLLRVIRGQGDPSSPE